MRSTIITGVGVLVLAALSAAGCGPTQPSGAGTPTSPATSAAATPSGAKPGPKTIPVTAFLQKEDTRSDEGPNVVSEPMLPPLCGAAFPSDTLKLARQTRNMRYYKAGTPAGNTPDGTVRQTITTYTADGGTTFLAEVKAAVEKCPQEKISQTVYANKLLTATPHGDETLLIERTYPTVDVNDKPTGGTEVRLIAVVRIGNVVTVLYETGWERGWSAEPATMETLTAKAEQRLRAWLG